MPEPMTYTGDQGDEAAVESREADERRKRWLGALLLALVLIVLIWLLLQYLAIVPSTIGMTRRRAVAVIEEAGFRSVVDTVTAGESLAGRVVGQSPVWGLRFVWRPINITVAASPGFGTANGSPGTPVTYDADYSIPLGTAPGTEPPSDAEEMEPLYVPVTPSERYMPNVQNLSESKARQKVGEVGLGMKIFRGPSTTSVAAGRVFYQSPTPGSRVSWGQTATVWISTGTLNIGRGGGFPYPRPTYP